jgi:hypothetical protein
MVPPDPSGGVSEAHFAVVHMPKRSRKRFSAGCVNIVDSKDAALAGANATEKMFAARVLGPSKSSEGQILFYLLEWLEG